MSEPMPSTDIDCPFCDAEAGTPCVPAREPHDGPMNHTERHIAWDDQQGNDDAGPAEDG